jgi:hypothetical protein
MSKINSILIVAVLIMQLLFLYFLLNPINLVNNLNSVNIVNEVVKTENLPINEFPQIGVIGDGKMLANIDDIKKANPIDANIYKDAQNGDYVLGYSNQLVIYRPSEKKVIYKGETPQRIQATQQDAILKNLIAIGVQNKLIPAEYAGVPQISSVTNADEVKKGGDLYKDVQNQDLVVNYPGANVIMVYRPSTQQVVKVGQVAINVK